MKIWTLKSNAKYSVTFKERKADLDFCTGEYINNWNRTEMNVVRKGFGNNYPRFLQRIPAMSKKVYEILKEYMKDQIQPLEVLVGDKEYVLINVLNITNAVNYDQSDTVRYEDGTVVAFKKIVFVEERIEGNIFKVKESANTDVFVTDVFRDAVLKTKIKGIDFELEWDSEEDVEETARIEAERIRNYERRIAEIDSYQGPRFSWSEAYPMVEQGRAMVSGKWKLQADSKGEVLIGSIIHDGSYTWNNPIFIPPVLLYLPWHEAEKSANLDYSAT
ncbi:imm11 family protein [Paenibacillus herberti]|uniref:Immunity MXAN-0049 protein domain-containing protein n=1 Tax=Paenibacillus herberti TaxID=1619309 RepID=A0A229NUB6_9BACL|nr:DUF1629 domain-containing protein [Paenibacillus herberti]OXM13452.1 hypothetical protein CGZ75_20615 [Paenibacillus herberti]